MHIDPIFRTTEIEVLFHARLCGLLVNYLLMIPAQACHCMVTFSSSLTEALAQACGLIRRKDSVDVL
jgi:hypothetical protein